MTTLAIDRFTATAHVPLDEPESRRVLDRMVATMAERTLDDALDRADLPSGDWFLDRLDVEVRMDLSEHDPSAERRWAEQIVSALQDALASGAAVHFPSRCGALADVISECALGRFDHAWAWRQANLLDGDLEGAPLDAVLTALNQDPELALSAVIRASRSAGVPAVHRLFGTRGWTAVAWIVLRAHAGSPAAALPGAAPSAVPDTVGAVTRADLALRATAVVRSSAVVQLLRRSRLRPDADTAAAWAVLAVADADPAVLQRAIAPAVITHVAAELSATAPADANVPTPQPPDAARPQAIARADPVAEAVGEAPDVATTNPDTPATSPGADDAEHIAPDERDEPVGAPTMWAGLLFLLATAERAGIPSEILDDEQLASRPLAWVLHAIACAIVPATADDPAVLAFAGLRPDDEPPSLAWRAATDVEREAVATHAQRWITVTAACLDHAAHEDATEVVRRIARRHGQVIAERGWIEVELPLDEVDIDVRRAGLDVDPGWVPWLGSVVQFRYV